MKTGLYYNSLGFFIENLHCFPILFLSDWSVLVSLIVQGSQLISCLLSWKPVNRYEQSTKIEDKLIRNLETC